MARAGQGLVFMGAKITKIGRQDRARAVLPDRLTGSVSKRAADEISAGDLVSTSQAGRHPCHRRLRTSGVIMLAQTSTVQEHVRWRARYGISRVLSEYCTSSERLGKIEDWSDNTGAVADCIAIGLFKEA